MATTRQAHEHPTADPIQGLLDTISQCTACDHLPLGPRPLLQASSSARILIAGQAPGRRTHAQGIPFDDLSGDRLREWLGVDRQTFYDSQVFAIVPMAFCYPGAGSSGDLPPPPRCARLWRQKVLERIPGIELTVLVGLHAQKWHLGKENGKSLSATVSDWKTFWPRVMPLPHPSPRNMGWLKKHPWVEIEMLPALQRRVRRLTG